MGPPTFIECYICHREFGSRSLKFHVPRCLERWFWDNKKVPKSERNATPSPPPNHPLHKSNLRQPSSLNSPTPKLSNSWPEERSRKSRPRSSTFMNRRKGLRPKTATLEGPKILDVNLCHEIDMSMMSRRMMEKLVLQKDVKVLSEYSSDFTSSSSSSSMSIKCPYEDDFTTESESDSKKIPEPCLTCGKEQNPERFHSHPKHMTKFKAKDKLAKDRNTKENPYKSINKLIVTKPNPLKFKSRSSESNSLNGSFKESKRHQKHKTLSSKVFKIKAKERKIKQSVSPNSPSKQSELENSINKDKNDKKPLAEIFRNNNTLEKDSSESEALSKQEEDELYDTLVGPLYENKKKTPPMTSPNTTRTGSAPLRTCYICGRDFGSRSLRIHEPQCLEKWKRENDNLSVSLRREEPRRPSKELTKEEWNEFAYKMAQAQLLPCDNCGRTFKPDRLEVHQRGCKPPPGSKKAQERQRDSSPVSNYGTIGRVSARPTRVCYICGREFGTKSITIHEPQCLMKFKNENEKLPEHLRRAEPRKPDLVLDESGKIDRNAMIEAAWQSHLETLVKCKGCNRTFLPDRLTVHQKACKTLKFF